MPVLGTVNDAQLLEWINIVRDELDNVCMRFVNIGGVVVDTYDKPDKDFDGGQNTPALVIGDTVIEAVKFVDEESNERKPVTDYDRECVYCRSNSRHYSHG